MKNLLPVKIQMTRPAEPSDQKGPIVVIMMHLRIFRATLFTGLFYKLTPAQIYICIRTAIHLKALGRTWRAFFSGFTNGSGMTLQAVSLSWPAHIAALAMLTDHDVSFCYRGTILAQQLEKSRMKFLLITLVFILQACTIVSYESDGTTESYSMKTLFKKTEDVSMIRTPTIFGLQIGKTDNNSNAIEAVASILQYYADPTGINQ